MTAGPYISVSKNNRFAASGPDLRIYKYADKPALELIPNNLSQVRLATWNPHEPCLDYLAISHRPTNSEGVVSIFKVESNESSSKIQHISDCGGEGRDCNILEWSLVNSGIILSGFAKGREESSALVLWDVSRAMVSQQGFETIGKYGGTHTAKSAAWLNGQSVFVAGMDSGKLSKSVLVAFDTRQEQESFSIVTKSILGACCDPTNDFRFATFGENGGIVKVWDSRYPIAAVANISTEYKNGVGGISWYGSSLSTAPRDGQTIKLWNLHTIAATGTDIPSSSDLGVIGTPETTIVSFQRSIAVPGSKIQLAHHRWSKGTTPTYLIYSFDREPRVGLVPVPVVPASQWSPKGELAIVQDGRIATHKVDEEIPGGLRDISVLIRERAVKGYAMVSDNLELVKDDPRLMEAWKYIQSIICSNSCASATRTN